MSNSTVVCQSPRPRKEAIELERWKYELIRDTILKLVPSDDIGIMHKQLVPLVRNSLSREQLKKLGSVYYYTTTVKLDLEVRGEIEQIPGMRPQYLRRIMPAEVPTHEP